MEKLEIVLPSKLDFLGVLAKIAEGLQGPFNLTEDEIFAISTALVEAGTNAVQHGGKTSNEPFKVTLEGNAERLVMEIEDRGAGFEPGDVDVHVTDEDHLFNSRGRGIFIMRSLMNEVNFKFDKDIGTCLTLVLHRKANGA